MGLIALITVASLGCVFTLFVLIFWVQDAKGKSKTRKTSSQSPRMQPFLVKGENGNQTRDVATTRGMRTGGLRVSEKAAQSEVSDSEMLARRRIVQVFATRMASRRDERTGAFPVLSILNIMHLRTPQSAILSAVIFNALIIIALVPLALHAVRYRPLERRHRCSAISSSMASVGSLRRS